MLRCYSVSLHRVAAAHACCAVRVQNKRAATQVSVMRCYLVHATQAGKPGVVRDFLAQHGDALLAGPSADEWAPWFALPFLRSASTDPRFQARRLLRQAHLS